MKKQKLRQNFLWFYFAHSQITEWERSSGFTDFKIKMLTSIKFWGQFVEAVVNTNTWLDDELAQWF